MARSDITLASITEFADSYNAMEEAEADLGCIGEEFCLYFNLCRETYHDIYTEQDGEVAAFIIQKRFFYH